MSTSTARRTAARTIRRILAATVISDVFAIGVAAPAFAVEATGPLGDSRCVPVTDKDWTALFLDSEEKGLLNQINAYRKANGRRDLSPNDVYNWPAAWASNDSALRGFSPSNHIDSLGRDVPTRMNQCTAFRNEHVGEINYWGQGGNFTTAAAALAWWKQSPLHNALLLNPTFRSVGLAKATKDAKAHWTVVFQG
jgi:uncharacterized protein YkwD